jgi:hypothetical protein
MYDSQHNSTQNITTQHNDSDVMTISTMSLRITTLSINDTLYNVTQQNNTQDETLGKMSSCITTLSFRTLIVMVVIITTLSITTFGIINNNDTLDRSLCRALNAPKT